MDKILWENVTGGIVRREYGITTFRLSVHTGDGRWAQRVDVLTSRLQEQPELFGETLDAMVRDIEARL